MADFNDPFAVPTTYRTSSEDVVSPAQRSLARQRLTADPVSDAITKTSQRKSDLGRTLESMTLSRDQFLDTKGSGLFVSDPMTKKRMTNPDGSFVPQMGAQIEALRQRAQTRVGTLRGAFTPAVAGDLTDDAKAAAAELSAIEPTYKAQMQTYERIQEQMARVQKARDEADIELGQLSMARIARTNPQMADDIFTLPPASISTPAPEVNQPPGGMNTAAESPAAEGPTFLGEMGKNAKDLGASFGVGANSLMKMVGDLYGLATGDMDNAVSRAGQYGVDYFNEMKSPEIRAAEAARKQKIDAADGEIGKALAYIRETVTNPMLLGSAVTEQLPNTVGTGGAGALVRVGAEKMLLKTLAAEAAKRLATKVGVGAAIATGAAMQGADVGANQYDELVTSLTEMPAAQAAQIPEIAEAMERGATLDEAKLALALTQARKTGAIAGAISVAAQKLPGGSTIERTIVGGGAGRSARGRIASAVAGAAGEAASEVIEEGGGQITKNVQARPVDPTREATAGLGETAGQALVTAAAMGGGAGALNGTGGAPDTTLGRTNGGSQVPPAPTAAPAADAGGRVGGVEDRPAPSGPKPFDQQYRVSFTDAQGQPAAQYFDVESDQQAIEEFQRANPGIQTFDVRSPITPATPVDAELQAELAAQMEPEAAPAPITAVPPASQSINGEAPSADPGEAGLPPPSAALPTQGPDSGAGSAPDEVAGVETAPVPAPTAQPIDAGDSDDLGAQAAQPASVPEGVATPDVGQTTAPNADVGAAPPAPTSSVPATPLPEAQIGGPLTSQPPTSASDSAQAPAPSPTPEPGPAARADFKLPRELAGAKPRFNYRDKEFSLTFDSELDKALFILAQKSPSKRDADFAREVTRQTGLSDADARKAGSLVREEIKSMAKEQGESGGLTVPVIHRASDFAPTPAPAPAAAPSPKPISPQPTVTATGPNSSLKKPQPPAAVAGGEKPSKKKPVKDTTAALVEKVDAAIEAAPFDVDPNAPASKRLITIQSGNSSYTVTNTKGTLGRLKQQLEKKQPPITNSGITGAVSATEKEAIFAYKEAKGEGAKRSAMDGLSEGSLKKLGLDGQYVKIAPGVTMTKSAAEALKKLRKGFTGEFEVEATTTQGVDDLDPGSPAAQSWRDVTPDELGETRSNDLRNFEAALNRSRASGEPELRLQPREYDVGRADSAAVQRGGPSGTESGQAERRGRARRFLEESFGKRIIFVEPSQPVTWGALSSPSSANTIIVNTTVQNPLMALIGHELGHNIKVQRPDLYSKLSDLVLDLSPMPEGYAERKKKQGYATTEKQRAEWVNDVIGARFDEPQFWREMGKAADAKGATEGSWEKFNFRSLIDEVSRWLAKLGERARKYLRLESASAFIPQIERLRQEMAVSLVEYQTGGAYPDNPSAFTARDVDLATPQEVKEKYPEQFSSYPEGQLPVEIRTPNGEVVPAVMNGYWDLRALQRGVIPSVGYKTDSGWSHGLLRAGEELLTDVPPPTEFGIEAATVADEPDQKKSQSPRTERAAGFPVEDIIYETRGHDIVSQEAKDFIEKNGEAKAASVALDSSNRSMPGDTRTFVLKELMDRQSKKMLDPKTSPEEQESLAREIQNLSAAYNPELRDAARQLSARQALAANNRTSAIDQYIRQTEEEQETAMGGKEATAEINKLMDDLNELGKTAIEKEVVALKKRLDAKPLDKPAWQRYKEWIANKVFESFDSLAAADTAEQPPLEKEVARRVLDEVKTRMAEVMPEKDKAGPDNRSPSAILRDAVKNKEKFGEAAVEIRKKLVSEYGEGSPIVEAADLTLASLGAKPYTKKLLDKVIKEAHDLMVTSATDIARQHWTKANRTNRDFTQALIDDAGFRPSDAKTVAEDLFSRMTELTADKKADLLKKWSESSSKVRKPREMVTVLGKAIQLNNLGAMTSAEMKNLVAKELKLPTVTTEQMRIIGELGDRVETAKNESDRARAQIDLIRTMKVYRGVKALDVATSLWYSNLLSGVTTLLGANPVGNVMQGTAQLGAVMAANPKHGAEAMRGWISGFSEGWQQGKAIWKTGVGTREINDVTAAKIGDSSDVLEIVDYKRDFPSLPEAVAKGLQLHARVMRRVGRFMKATDAVFYYPAREAYARVVTAKLLEGQYKGKELYTKVREMLGVAPDQFVKAEKQAEDEGFTGIDKSLRVSAIIEEGRQRTPEAAKRFQDTVDFGKRATYNNDPEGWAGVLYQNIVPLVESVRPGGFPIMRAFLPFLRVPTNVFNASLNFTPVGAARAFIGSTPTGTVRDKSTNKFSVESRNFSKDERRMMYYQATAGSMAMFGLAALALSGADGEEPSFDITATGPEDFKKRQQLEATGWRPHSVKLGNVWVSYKDSPLLMPLAVSGHVVDAIRYGKQSDELAFGNKVSNAVLTAPRAIFESSMLSGLTSMMDFASGNASSKQVEGFLARTASSLVVPNALQQIDRIFDSRVREASGPLGTAGAALPFVRRTGDVKTDVFGEAVERTPFRRFGGVESNDPLREVLRDKKVFISTPSRDTKLGNGPMDEDQYREFVRTSGERINQRLRPFTATLRRMTPEQAERAVDKVVREERERAKNIIRAGSPSR